MFECNFCHYSVIVKRRKDKFEAGIGPLLLQSPLAACGLRCSSRGCKGFVCAACLTKLVGQFSSSVQRSDPWCLNVLEYLATNETPDCFIGNCCEWKVERQQIRLAKRVPPPNLHCSTDTCTSQSLGCLLTAHFTALTFTEWEGLESPAVLKNYRRPGIVLSHTKRPRSTLCTN